MYTPEFTNMTSEHPRISIGNTSSNGEFSIVMLVVGGVSQVDQLYKGIEFF